MKTQKQIYKMKRQLWLLNWAIWSTYTCFVYRLTAFVAKVFCQAENVVDGVVDSEKLNQTLSYIAASGLNGQYVDKEPVKIPSMQVCPP